MNKPAFPLLYQLNTRATLNERGVSLGRAATLDDVPDTMLDRLAADGFDWIWLLGVWQTGDAGRRVSRTQPDWQPEYRELLIDYTADDVCGSPFAIADYVVNRDFGGPDALDRLRRRIAARGMKLMLDFVPNHTALDHPWATQHPEYYIHGSDDDLSREPGTYVRLDTRGGSVVFAHGRDPSFPSWPDTLQVNYRHPALREAMAQTLERIAGQCDGVRCDMAMLVLPDVIERTWGGRSDPADAHAVDESFWPSAIERVRRRRQDFVFMAEVYWDLEWSLQQQGFDYTYDKRLYDRLRDQNGPAVRGHLQADAAYQRRSARFIENHDEPRAAAVFPPMVNRAAAVIAMLVPGLRLVHDGQSTGRRLRMSNHLRRRAPEPIDRDLEAFYARLFECLRRGEVRNGRWQLLAPEPAWDGNATSEDVVAFSWDDDGRRLVVAVNYAPHQTQCYLRLPLADAGRGTIVLRDLMNPTIRYERDGEALARAGLYLDVPPWRHHVFEVTAREA